MGTDAFVEETSYKKQTGNSSIQAKDSDANREVLENNKKSNICFGSDNRANFNPSVAKDSFTKQEIDPFNR